MANTISLSRRKITIIPDGSTDFDITTIQTNKFRMTTQTGDFTAGESVTQATSGATGVVRRWDKQQQILYLDSMVGTFDAAHVVTGASSGAHGIPAEVDYAFPRGIRLSAVDFYPSNVNDVLAIRENIATGPVVYQRRDTSGSGIHQSVGGKSLQVKLFILATDCQFNTAANAKIILEYD